MILDPYSTQCYKIEKIYFVIADKIQKYLNKQSC